MARPLDNKSKTFKMSLKNREFRINMLYLNVGKYFMMVLQRFAT